MDHIGLRLQAFKSMSNNLLPNGIVSVVVLIVIKVLLQIRKKPCPVLTSSSYRSYHQHFISTSTVTGIVGLMANLAAFAAACKTVKVTGLILNKRSFININKIFNIVSSLILGIYILMEYRASVAGFKLSRSIKESLQNSKFERIKTSFYSSKGEKVEATILVNPNEEMLVIKTSDGKDFERNIEDKLVFLHVGCEDVIQGFVKYLREQAILSQNDRVSLLHRSNQDVQVFSSVPKQPKLAKSIHTYPHDLTFQELGFIQGNFNEDKRQLNIDVSKKIDVSIRLEDIFDSGADVIVNAANTHLGGGGGIDGLIHEKGGKGYKEAHKDLKRLYPEGYISGHAAMITSGDLKEKGFDNVIVVAGPQGAKSDLEKEAQLYSCYMNSLILAHQEKKKHIAFPSISTGIYDFPKDRAASISLKAIYDFIQSYPEASLETISIHFLPNATHEDSLDFYVKALAPLNS